MIGDTMDKVNNELEVDQFIRAMKQMRIMLKALFTKTERFLISNNRRFLVGKKIDRIKVTDFSSKNKQNMHSQEDLGYHFDFLMADSGLCLNYPNLVLSEPIRATKLTTVKP